MQADLYFIRFTTSLPCSIEFDTHQFIPKKIHTVKVCIFFGAGGENRTRIACLEGRHISHYTTPACLYDYTSSRRIIKSTTMIQLHNFDNNDNHFHSSGYAREAHGQSIGSTSAQSYSERAHIERNRRHVNRYSASMIGRRLGHSEPRVSSTGSQPRRAELAPPPGRTGGPGQPHRFTEPTQRYNPYA